MTPSTEQNQRRQHSTKTCHFRTQPRGYENSINALDGVTDAGHHRVDLLGEVVLSVQTETFLLLELLKSIGSLTGCQCGAILYKNEKDRDKQWIVLYIVLYKQNLYLGVKM